MVMKTTLSGESRPREKKQRPKMPARGITTARTMTMMRVGPLSPPLELEPPLLPPPLLVSTVADGDPTPGSEAGNSAVGEALG